MKTKLEIIKEDTEHIYETYKMKNSNYGDSFTKTIDELGEVAGLVPLYNKIHRATSLIKNGGNNFESLEDTLLDLATYALMLDADIKTRNHKEDSKESNTCTFLLEKDNCSTLSVDPKELSQPYISDLLKTNNLGTLDSDTIQLNEIYETISDYEEK